MKLCPNCHRLSKDDDFCSYCGSAVYDDNTDYSIDCSQIKGHTHEKQTFSENSSYQSYRQTSSNSSPEAKKKGKGCLTLIIFFIVINVIAEMLSGGFAGLVELLGNLLNEI